MTAESPTRDYAGLWVLVPFVLAVLGTIVMLFTNSANILKVSLILALWAAAAGILVIARLRRDRDEAERVLTERDQLHQAELEAATARAEAARSAQAGAGDAPGGADMQVLREIQEELKALRAQLTEMSGRQFEYEPAALRAEARRIAELGATRPEPKPEPAPVVETVEPEPASPSSDGPSAAETARLQPIKDVGEPKRKQSRPAGAPTSEAIAGRLGAQPSKRSVQHNPLSQLISERQAEASAAPEPADTPKPATAPKSRPAPTLPSAAEPAPTEAPKQHDQHERHGRRRRDERGSNAVSVAELLARRNEESK
ncbi:DUF6779 domain-containing protein [Corynebacterium sp. LK2510]|uniref:DUF6779 domain-containing protein n=1 Tax=Corynebacterium sp. LK2510 TaxID=3110472 RepID=UPI0034CED164